MNLADRIIDEAIKHLGEDYVYGANVDFTNAHWDGPWDCAEFVSWVIYQITGKVFGCLDNNVPIDDVEPFTGGWKRDIKQAAAR